jgi:hypothetical protein
MHKIVVLYPYKFSKYNFFQYGFDQLKKKKIEIEIHDLSNLFISKKFQKLWTAETNKDGNLKFNNFFSWLLYIINISPHTVIFNLTNDNFNSIYCFLVKFTLAIRGFTIFIFKVTDVFNVKPKKNFYYFFFKIFIEHKYDIYFYFNFFKRIIFTNLDKIIKYKKEIIFTNESINKKYHNYSKAVIFKSIHSFDYSNFLRIQKKNTNKYFVYLDCGFPYHLGDTFLEKSIRFNYDKSKIQEYMSQLLNFFYLIEKKFKKKILIVPHPKYRVLNSNIINIKFFKNFLVFNKIDTNEAVKQAYCVLTNAITTSLSFAVLNYKRIIFLKSKLDSCFITSINDHLNKNELFSSLDIENVNIDSKNYLTEKIKNKINNKAYDKYKFKFLQNSNKYLQKKSNSDIIANYIINDLKT